MNKSNKGYRFERNCRNILKEEGWSIAFKSIRTRFGTQDFAGLFDIVAIKERERRYISCKVLSNAHGWIASNKIAIKEFKKNHGYENEFFEIWIKKNRKIERIIC